MKPKKPKRSATLAPAAWRVAASLKAANWFGPCRGSTAVYPTISCALMSPLDCKLQVQWATKAEVDRARGAGAPPGGGQVSACSCSCSVCQRVTERCWVLVSCYLALAPSKESCCAVPAYMPAAARAPVNLLLSARVQSSTAQAAATDLPMSLPPSAFIKHCHVGLMLPSPWGPLDV